VNDVGELKLMTLERAEAICREGIGRGEIPLLKVLKKEIGSLNFIFMQQKINSHSL
jgi:hypothetical protein